ncbi:MAG: glycoside hydrolase family 2 TIM barrel-domain containing protein [Terracidiphilus sp.]|nr:glycoside hydrolase family 2 TIM barrel-domain containing protein [Terracidiphilus sp.]
MLKLRSSILAVILALSVLTPAMASRRIDLSGAVWTFRTTLGERVEVSVPHSWPVNEQYRRYIGVATYEHDFDAPDLKAHEVVRLHFDAVYEHASVWLNGRHLGTHDGGYTPFEFDVTDVLKQGRNHLLVEVNNTPTLDTIPAIATSNGPGSRNAPVYGSAAGEGIVGWMPYGGIVRPVSLLVSDAVYFENVKIDAKPDLVRHIARITVRARVHNSGAAGSTVAIGGTVAGTKIAFRAVRVAGSSDAEVSWAGTLDDAHLWSVRDPFLYDAVLEIPGDEVKTHFGVREIRVEGTQLLLNGRAVHLFGANRVSEDEHEGLRESDAIVERDMSDMLACNMRMMRIAHYPQVDALLDFADRHGMLIVPEAGNWNMGAWQMADPGIRTRWKHDMREMMEQDWNHPSVIAWSVGNEYESYTREGIEWTRDMRAYTLGLDATRLITFASRFTGDPSVKTGADEASQYSDFVSVNFYRDYARAFDDVHDLYPTKPVFVSEFGKMGEEGIHDPERIQEITTAVEAMKARPWIIGGSLWSWADYRSLHRGTPASGIRNWGVVMLDRTHRDSWEAVRKLFAAELP